MSTCFQDPVLISGAGVGGLTLALALAKKGIASHVFERRDTFSIEGAGIQVGPNGARILIALGLEVEIRACAGTPSHVVPYDGRTGAILARLPIGPTNNAGHTAPYWTMHRANLHGALASAAQDCLLIQLAMGTEVIDTRQTPDNVTAVMSDGASVTGRVLVAADGIHSRLRKAWGIDIELRAIGKSAARTLVPAADFPKEIEKSHVGLWLAPGAHVVHYPVQAGNAIALVAIFDDDDVCSGWTTPVSQDWIAEKSEGLHNNLHSILHAATRWQKWSLATSSPLKKWSNGRTTLLGDAAHPVLPFLAQGGVMAMEDAVVLAELLSKTPANEAHALRNYEHLRQPRTKRVARESARNGRIYHQSGIAAFVRNATMKAIGGTALINRYRWLYDWQVNL